MSHLGKLIFPLALLFAQAVEARDKRTLETECPAVTSGQIEFVKAPNFSQGKKFLIQGSITQDGFDGANAARNYLLEESQGKKANSNVVLSIDSSGGDMNTAFGLMDSIKIFGQGNVITLCTGEAKSAAALLLAAGGKGMRFATENCDIMTHSVRSTLLNPDIRDTSEPARENRELYKPEYLKLQQERSKIQTERMRAMFQSFATEPMDNRCAVFLTRDDPTYLTSLQALKLGLIDYVLQPNGMATRLKTAAPAQAQQ